MATAPYPLRSIGPFFQQEEEVFESAPASNEDLALIIAKLRDELAQTKHENTSLRGRIKALLLEHETQLSEERSKAEHLAARVEALSTPRTKREVRPTDDSWSENFVRIDPTEAQRELIDKSKELIEVKARLQQLEVEFAPLNEALQAADKERTGLKESLQALRAQVDKITHRCQSFIQENSTIKEQNSQLDALKSQLETKLKEKERSILSLEENLKKIETLLNEEKAKSARLEEENEALKRPFYLKFKELLRQLFFAIFGFLFTGIRR